MYKRIIVSILFFFVFTGCEDTDVRLAMEAGVDAVKAATLDDEKVRRLAIEVSRQSDLKHDIASPDIEYATRLRNLVGNYYQTEGYEFNYKVYLSPKVNAFAMADGTIRIYSGLMDMMNDGEMLFVIGHEMGHVVKKHIKKKIMFAYAGSAVRKGIASQRNQIGEIANSNLGGFIENLLNAQYSQQEEREADDYGIWFLKNGGHDVELAVSALKKFSTLGNNHSFLSSHPAPEARAKRLLEIVQSPQKMDEPSTVRRIIDWVKGYLPFGDSSITHLRQPSGSLRGQPANFVDGVPVSGTRSGIQL